MVENTGINREQWTPCISKKCAHSKARNWIQCASCQGWWHCVCANVTHTKAVSDSFEFICSAC